MATKFKVGDTIISKIDNKTSGIIIEVRPIKRRNKKHSLPRQYVVDIYNRDFVYFEDEIELCPNQIFNDSFEKHLPEEENFE